MKIEEDGFKIPEHDDNVFPDVMLAIVDNLKLLRDRIRKLEDRPDGHHD